MEGLANRRILLGVCGGIAAYKSPELVRRLKDEGAQVQVVMTAGAAAFVTPLTLQTVSENPVASALLDPEQEFTMGHIELARWAERVVIAPATAHTMAKLSHGLADDLLSTLCLACNAPLLLAPAMNRQMWDAPATRENRSRLGERGIGFVGPEYGSQACGEVGAGRMSEPQAIVSALRASFTPGHLRGLRVMVTAGPTREPIDPVRYLSNRSSGKMGYAVARAAKEAGAEVLLVSGPSVLPAPDGVEIARVETAEEMLAAVLKRIAGVDIFIAAAAVADYRPHTTAQAKLKRDGQPLKLSLTPTVDILAQVAGLRERPFIVGFAAETQNLRANARDKLQRKALDLVAANLVGRPGTGFDGDRNDLVVYSPDGEVALGEGHKSELAQRLVELIARRFREAGRAEDTRSAIG